MKPQTLDNARLALASNINRPMLDYYREKLQDTLASLMNCDEKTFRQYQGRALELGDMIKFIESVK